MLLKEVPRKISVLYTGFLLWIAEYIMQVSIGTTDTPKINVLT